MTYLVEGSHDKVSVRIIKNGWSAVITEESQERYCQVIFFRLP